MSELYHYGTPRHSGRYPWGSGENPYQHTDTFLSRYRELKAKGMTQSQIASAMNFKSTTELRAKLSVESDNEKAEIVSQVLALKAKGYSNVKIGEMMGMNESSVRSYIKQSETQRYDATKATADMLMQQVAEKGFIDVGVGVERELDISKTKLDTAVAMLKEKGYSVHSIEVPQATMPGQYTTVKVLAPPGTEQEDIYKNLDQIHSINTYSPDGGKTYWVPEHPASLSSDRIMIRYAEQGGLDKDGVIELRRGPQDLSLDKANYAQVRIAVDDKYYLKGMALYSDGKDMPPGVDVIFNTNKHEGTPFEKVVKPLSNDPDNPFGGAAIKAGGQYHWTDENGEEHLGVVNRLREEGDWDEYSKNLSSQFLSKQSLPLINRQLNLAYAERKEEYAEISNLTNPVLKKKLLDEFADNCDAAAAHLKAAALPRQTTKVILPLTDISENEVYAPSYRNGEKVVLIRYPHGGTFEIPELTVNNKNKQGIDILGNTPVDAIGIHKKVADRLSGADFDGDTVVVIPVNSRVKVTTTPPLKGLENFEPKEQYREVPGMKKLSEERKGFEMGSVSNLITDMTLRGAKDDEIARAVRHSMVVIDAPKHSLNYKQSEKDNGIAALKTKYQGGPKAGASTLISQSKAKTYIPERKQGVKVTDPVTGKTKVQYVDPETGEKLYSETGRTRWDKKAGKYVLAETKVKRMDIYKDARDLSSGTLKEEAYANYANKLKALANEARKVALGVRNEKMSPSAKSLYSKEVASLDAKLNTALKNAPKERQAQLIAATKMRAAKRANPNMDTDDVKKMSNRELANARAKVGANKKDVYVDISENEWKAIQAGAVSSNKQRQIFNNTDPDKLKKLATPHNSPELGAAKQARIKAMSTSGYTTSEIADALGVSSSTVSKYLKGDSNE